jgi:tRNA A-37 threonylcarbamoyl transferase component Bud32
LLDAELSQLLGAPVALEVLKEKPGRRRTLRATGARRSAIVKVYVSERAPTVAARLAALGDGPAEPRVPEVLLVESASRAVVLSELPGRPLRKLLLSGDACAAHRAGRAIGAWHLAWRSRCPHALREHTVERELQILERRADGARAPTGWAVRTAARELSEPWPCSTVVHRDLYEDQIVLGEDVGLIDLDDAACGPPELDAGNLLAHVELLALRSARDLEPMSHAFLAGYAESGAPLTAGRLDQCRRLALLRLACIHDEPALISLATGAAVGGATVSRPHG